MVDVRAKGASFEKDIRDKLRVVTKKTWERAPSSGALDARYGMKGDIILPVTTGAVSLYAIECKAYADDQISSNLIYPADQVFDGWWAQTVREASQMNMKPMLVFKKNRGKHMLAIQDCLEGFTYLHLHKKNGTNCYIYLFDEVINELTLFKEFK